jgi:hypothetical protein
LIIVKLQGGLGNQLFQYALGRRLAMTTGQELVLDHAFLRRREKAASYTPRDFELGIFENISARHCRTGWRRLAMALALKTKRFRRVAERSPRFDPSILKLRGPVYLDGFWQSEQYFEDIRAVLLRELAFHAPADYENRAYVNAIRSANAVAIHIRRGDYVSAALPPTYHDLSASGYYKAAMGVIGRTVIDPVYFVFSDDIPWVMQHVPIAAPHHFIGHNTGKSSFNDLRLMSLCRHHIIANSSFSWWGAWLGGHPGKTVVAPQQWFLDPAMDTTDLLPHSWIRV